MSWTHCSLQHLPAYSTRPYSEVHFDTPAYLATRPYAPVSAVITQNPCKCSRGFGCEQSWFQYTHHFIEHSQLLCPGQWSHVVIEECCEQLGTQPLLAAAAYVRGLRQCQDTEGRVNLQDAPGVECHECLEHNSRILYSNSQTSCALLGAATPKIFFSSIGFAFAFHPAVVAWALHIVAFYMQTTLFHKNRFAKHYLVFFVLFFLKCTPFSHVFLCQVLCFHDIFKSVMSQ